jgi:hypothetical protein
MGEVFAERIGLPTATALVIGSIIGTGIFALPASLAPYGPVSLVAFGLVTVGALALTLVFGWLHRQVPGSGGPYLYARDAFGDFGWFTWAQAVKRNVLRDLSRVEHKIVGVSEQVWQIRRWLDRHPGMRDPREIAEGIVGERQRGRSSSIQARLGVEHALQMGGVRPLVSCELVRQALAIPEIIRLEQINEVPAV